MFTSYLQNLEKALQSFPAFQRCMEYKGATEPLPDKRRDDLVKAIVEYTTLNFIWIKQSEFEIVFKKIKELFPMETMDNYYIEKKEGQKSAGGELYNRFRYFHSMLQKETGIKKNRNPKKDDSIEHNENTEDFDNTMDELRRELIGRHDPWDQILIDWRKTYDYRRNDILSKGLAQSVPRWPKFKNKQGPQLVSILLLHL